MWMNGKAQPAEPAGPPKPNTPMLLFLRQLGVDPQALIADFHSAKDWLIKALTHYKQRFDAIEQLNREAIETHNRRIDELEKMLIENHKILTAAVMELQNIVAREYHLPPEQNWDDESLEKALGLKYTPEDQVNGIPGVDG